MKLLCSLLFILFLHLINAEPALAQNVTPTPQVNPLNENQASSSGILNSFFSSFDWISNGIIFNTPNLLENTIKLSDGTELSGISQFRTIFSDIAIPIFAVIINFIALSHITGDNSYQLKNFLKRLVVVVVLFILTPYILSYSIEFINLLNNKINAQNSFNIASFITDYINSGDLLKLLGFTTMPITILFSPSSIMQLLVLIVSIGFFLLGFLYIVFQAIFRFIALLFLSVLFPLVLPFALSSKTENIANTYFRTWFTFLIQQPAFVLGFAIVSAILGSILKAHGGNIGTLFLYSGSLIFLGGVNVFVGRIFGEGWSLLSTNARSMLASGAITGLGIGTVKEMKRGAITGRASGIRSYAGMYLGNKIRLLNTADSNSDASLSHPDRDNINKSQIKKLAENTGNTRTLLLPAFSKQLQSSGINTEVVNKKQGLVKVQGQGYSYTDKKSGLTTTYLSKSDALSSGKKETELKTTKINHLVVDHSYFNKDNPIPYGNEAIAKTNNGLKIKSYLGHMNYPERVKEYLDLSKEDLQKNKAKGLLMKQYDTPENMRSKKKTLRIYSTEPL